MKLLDLSADIPEFNRLAETEPECDHVLNGQINVVYADLPIMFQTWSKNGEGRTPQAKYDTMSFLDCARLPIKALRAPKAVLILWIFDTHLFDINGVSPYHQVARAWGFPYYGGKFGTYLKTIKSGNRARIGLGFTTRKSTEQCYMWTSGRTLPRVDKGVGEVSEDIDWYEGGIEEFTVPTPRLPGHSAKPAGMRQAIDRLYGQTGVNILELFARDTAIWPDREPAGTWYWHGNQVTGTNQPVQFTPLGRETV